MTQFPPFRFLVIRDNAVFGGSTAVIGLRDRGLGFEGTIVPSTSWSCLVARKIGLRLSLRGDESTLKTRLGVAEGKTHQWGHYTKLRRTHTKFILSLVLIHSLIVADIHDRRKSLLFLRATPILIFSSLFL